MSLLVSIYGSKELFVSEYRLMLADRLLTRRTHDTDREVQNLELLKLRFGEASLHHCEIMIRCVSLLPSSHPFARSHFLSKYIYIYIYINTCTPSAQSALPPPALSQASFLTIHMRCHTVCDAGMWTTQSA